MDENQISSLAASFCSIALKKGISQQRVYTAHRATQFWGYGLFVKPSVGSMREQGIQNHSSCHLGHGSIT